MRISMPLKNFASFLTMIGLCCVTAFPATAAEDAAQDERDLLAPVNDLGIGTFSGQAKMLLMRRNFDTGAPDGDANSGTIALTLDYLTPEWHGLSGGAQYIYVWQFFEGGSLDHPRGAGWVLGNSDYDLFNEAFVRYNLTDFGLPETTLTAGRRILDLDFAPAYPYRQKAQSYQGIFLETEDIPDVSLILGHIEKFSSWFSRDDTRGLSPYFRDVEEIGTTVSYSTEGVEFGSISYTGIPRTEATLYDFYSHDLYNTFGAKLAHALPLGENVEAVLKGHFITQSDVGRMDRDGEGEVDSELYDFAIQFKCGNLSVEPGVTTVAGDDARHNLRVPFRTSLTIDAELLWYTRQFLGGTDSYYVKSTYTWGDTLFYLLYVAATHEDNVGGGAFDQEINFIIKHSFTENLFANVKIGFGHQDNDGGMRDATAEDWRLEVGCRF